MIANYKELMLELLFVHKGGFFLGSHASVCVDLKTLWGPNCYVMLLTPWEVEHDLTVQFLVQIESTKELDIIIFIVIKLLLH